MPDQEWINSLPRKAVASAALIIDERDRVMLVKPRYRPHWGLPGGAVDRLESPLAACRREVFEEVGIQVTPTHPLCVNYIDTKDDLQLDHLEFIFDGGLVDSNTVVDSFTPNDEIEEIAFVEQSALKTMVASSNAPRILAALRARSSGPAIYLEDGQPAG